MNIVIVNFSEISHNQRNANRLDAIYWIGKKNGMNAHTKVERGFVVEDDKNGKIMLSEKDSEEYNRNILELRRLKRKINKLTNKIHI